MVNSTPSLDFIIHHFGSNNIEICYYSWPKQFDFNYFDIGVKISIFGNIHLGRGIHRSERIALEKASSESIERYLFHSLQLPIHFSTAVHPSRNKAQIHSVLEAYERDSFLFPFLLKHRPEVISSQFYTELLPSQTLKYGIEYELLKLPVCHQKMHSYCFAAKGHHCLNPFGVVVGLGCDFNSQKAIEKSLTECFARLAPLLFNQIDYNNSSDPTKISSLDHFKNALNLNYRPKLFFGKKVVNLHFPINKPIPCHQSKGIIHECFEIKELLKLHYDFFNSTSEAPEKPEIPETTETPKIFFSYYFNPLLQGLFRGPNATEKINSKRILLFKEELCSIETALHPLG